MTIVTETHALIRATLAGDRALTSLIVSGSAPDTVLAQIDPGLPPGSIGSRIYSPTPPFHRETIVELLVRMQRQRWRRAAPFAPLAMPPTEDDLQTLHNKHAPAVVSFECFAGWTDLLDAVFIWLHHIAPDQEWAPSQIKEKHGTLRFYWQGDLPQLGDEIIEAAEHISSHLCEVCGALGKLKNEQGWRSTRCAEHKNWRPS